MSADPLSTTSLGHCGEIENRTIGKLKLELCCFVSEVRIIRRAAVFVTSMCDLAVSEVTFQMSLQPN